MFVLPWRKKSHPKVAFYYRQRIAVLLLCDNVAIWLNNDPLNPGRSL